MTTESSPTPHEPQVDQSSAVAAAISLWAVAPLLFLVMPVYVGALADDLGMSTQRIGSIASIEMLGLAVASFLAVLWIRRWSWRTVAWVSIVALVAANLLSFAAVDHFGALVAVRILAGIAAGSTMSSAIAAKLAIPLMEHLYISNRDFFLTNDTIRICSPPVLMVSKR